MQRMVLDYNEGPCGSQTHSTKVNPATGMESQIPLHKELAELNTRHPSTAKSFLLNLHCFHRVELKILEPCRPPPNFY
jgi:hypothetical protein